MSGAREMFGWDLLYRLVENSITRKEDVLVALVHWKLINCGFKCLGIGNDTTIKDSETGSEALPEDWNKEASYALRYVYEDKLYVLRGARTEDDILFNLLLMPDLNVAKALFHIDETVKSLKGPIETLIPTYKEAIAQIQKDLLDPVFSGVNKEATTQTPAQPQQAPEYDPLRIDRPRPERAIQDPDALWDPLALRDPLRDPLQVGRSDLDPFARGGGMIFNPFGRGSRGIDPEGPPGLPGSLPRGAVPPGARFDPFGPPGLGRRGGRGGPSRGGFGAPDHDHLPPPGYEDMFM